MNRKDIRQHMTAIADNLLETSANGVHWLPVKEQFVADHAAELDDFTDDLRDDYLRHVAANVVNSLRRDDNAQLELPGFGNIDGTVTTFDGEGGYVTKKLAFATVDDLLRDAEVHAGNVQSARDALRRARIRNKALIPVMEEHGFATAGEALELLAPS